MILYTEKDSQLFQKMFIVKIEKTAYYDSSLKTSGLVEDVVPFENSYNSASVEITLSNEHVYVISYGKLRNAEDTALEAFNYFKEVNYDENALEQYLIKKENEGIFEAYS